MSGATAEAGLGAGLEVTAAHVFGEVAGGVSGGAGFDEGAAFGAGAAFGVAAAFNLEAAFGVGEAGAI